METAVKPAMTPILNPETASVARYLESAPVYRFTERLVEAWAETDMDHASLATELCLLVRNVAGRHPHVAIDLDEVDWDFLAERYAEMFA